jgi:hypothetical protein
VTEEVVAEEVVAELTVVCWDVCVEVKDTDGMLELQPNRPGPARTSQVRRINPLTHNLDPTRHSCDTRLTAPCFDAFAAPDAPALPVPFISSYMRHVGSCLNLRT